MRKLTIDFETYFDQEYTLSKIPTSEYVRSKWFHPWGFAYKWGDGETGWVGPNQKEWLKKVDWKNTTVIMHNARFDGFILTQHFKVHPARYICTQFMANTYMQPNRKSNLDAVAQEYGFPAKPVDAREWMGREEFTQEEVDRIVARAIGDVERTYAIYQKMAVGFPEAEFDLIDLTVKMFTEPRLVLDKAKVEAVGRKHHAFKRKLMREALPIPCTFAAREDILRSDQKFAAYLEGKGITPPYKYSQAQMINVPAFAANDLEFMLWKNDPELKRYYDARTTIKSTQTDSKVARLLAQAPPYKVAVSLKYHGAHTMRFSGDDKSNFQNMERGSDIRKSLKAPKGYRVGAVDASQIEARLNAYTAGQDDLLNAFAEGRDPYKEQAKDVYKLKSLEEVTPDQRFVGKTLILAAGYNMGAEKFQLRLSTDKHNPLKIPYHQANNAITSYRMKNSAIVDQWETMNDILLGMVKGEEWDYAGLHFMSDRVLMPNKLFLRYPDLQQAEDTKDVTYEGIGGSRRKIYGGYFTENIVQCLARILLCEHMLEIAKHYRVVLTVHDEIVFLIPEKRADDHFKKALAIAQKPPPWAPDLPVAAEGVHAPEYAK